MHARIPARDQGSAFRTGHAAAAARNAASHNATAWIAGSVNTQGASLLAGPAANPGSPSPQSAHIFPRRATPAPHQEKPARGAWQIPGGGPMANAKTQKWTKE